MASDGERLGAELNKEKGCRQESEAKAERLTAEVARCHALINAASHQAAERECRLTSSVVKIQAKWRQVLSRRCFLQERSERAWRRKQAKFQAETPYDAILVSIALLARYAFCICIFSWFVQTPNAQKLLKELVPALHKWKTVRAS